MTRLFPIKQGILDNLFLIEWMIKGKIALTIAALFCLVSSGILVPIAHVQ